MKKYLFIVTTTVAILGCQFASATVSQEFMVSSVQKNPKTEIKTVTFSASLHCKACVNKVMENISFEKGVKDLKVDLEKREITVKYDSSRTSVEKLAAAIEKLGYKVEVVK
ncbi:MAG: heavy-metal-associated domain-containing protein [Candidatus Cryptobacteroides sp.]